MRAFASVSRVAPNALRIVCLSAALWAALFSFVSAESIMRFHVDILVEADGRMIVTEDITYLFTSPRHGIYRTVKGDHAAPASSWYLDRRIETALLSVARDGQPEPYTVDRSFDGLSVRIGDPNRTIVSDHRYRISYVVDGAINQTPDGYEVYWNATGDEWEVSMQDIEVVVRAGEGARILGEQACYSGASGGTDRCESASFQDRDDGVVAVFTEPDLSPGEQLTIAQRVGLASAPTVIEEPNWVLVLAICMVFWFALLFVFLWRWEHHHRTGRTIIAQYEPFRDFKPMFTGVLMDGRLDSKDITAGIIRLAQEGFISIKQTKEKVLFLFETNDYAVTLTKKPFLAPTPAHAYLLKLLFEGQGGVDEVDTKPKSFSLEKEVLGSMNMYVGKTIRLSEVKQNASKLKHNTKILEALRKQIEKDLVDGGFIEQTMSRAYKAGAVVLLTFVIIITIQFVAVMSVTLMLIMLFIAVNALIVIGVVAERRTALGYQALDHLKGFKRFLSVTDAERFAFHNAPSKNPQQFMQYLPYAIAFGVEEEWADVFKDIQIDPPDWYSSDVPNASFSAIAFGNELSSFSQSFVSSTGSSGSSGGGSSGGGSGGGGGGSW